MIRFFDLLLSVTVIILLSPLIILVAIWVTLDSPGGPFFLQWRVGLKGREFRIIKFRTMYSDTGNGSSLTIGDSDLRITNAGQFLRRYKLDELPQLFNIIIGDMSLVGPRPELRKYVTLYNTQQLKTLEIRPGLTDIASIIFSDENKLLGTALNPESVYINKIIPLKIRLNNIYRINHSIRAYFLILGWTVLHLLHISISRIQQLEKICKSRITGLPEIRIMDQELKKPTSLKSF
jgi:lipopolysaccharide/colanic/teichoic acid biosynthesis glycosyltransferase